MFYSSFLLDKSGMILPQVKIRSPVARGHTDGLQILEVSRSPSLVASTSENRNNSDVWAIGVGKNTANEVQGLMVNDKYIPCCFLKCQRKKVWSKALS